MSGCQDGGGSRAIFLMESARGETGVSQQRSHLKSLLCLQKPRVTATVASEGLQAASRLGRATKAVWTPALPFAWLLPQLFSLGAHTSHSPPFPSSWNPVLSHVTAPMGGGSQAGSSPLRVRCPPRTERPAVPTVGDNLISGPNSRRQFDFRICRCITPPQRSWVTLLSPHSLEDLEFAFIIPSLPLPPSLPTPLSLSPALPQPVCLSSYLWTFLFSLIHPSAFCHSIRPGSWCGPRICEVLGRCGNRRPDVGPASCRPGTHQDGCDCPAKPSVCGHCRALSLLKCECHSDCLQITGRDNSQQRILSRPSSQGLGPVFALAL